MEIPIEQIRLELEELRQQLSTILLSKQQTTEIIDRQELCKRLNITKPTAIRWEKKGKIPSMRIGGNVRYNWPTVIEALERRK
jgi:excisionase family DNA binding protein